MNHCHSPQTTTECIYLEKRMLDYALLEWEEMQPLGSSFTAQAQKDVFGDVFVENPLFIQEMALTSVAQQEQDMARKNQVEKARALCQCLGNILSVSSSGMYSMRHARRHIELYVHVSLIS